MSSVMLNTFVALYLSTFKRKRLAFEREIHKIIFVGFEIKNENKETLVLLIK
jgi:hypothetical protein